MDVWRQACRNIVSYTRDAIPATTRLSYPMGHKVHRIGSSYDKVKDRAAKKNIAFDLTRKEYADLQSASCYLCGIQGQLGADRQDNSLGYTLSNVRPCCTCCNYVRRTKTLERVKEMCAAVCAAVDLE